MSKQTATDTRAELEAMSRAFLADPSGWPAAMGARALRLAAGHPAYSPTNQGLIFAQTLQRVYVSDPGASDAQVIADALAQMEDETAPASVWRKRGYTPVVGTGLWIWSKPITLWTDETGARAYSAARLEGEEVKAAGRVFKAEQTYLARDVRNADGSDARADWEAPELPSGTERDVFARLAEWIGTQGWQVSRSRKSTQENGSTCHAARRIVIHGGLAKWEAVETLAHEIAHALLHGADDERPYAGEHRGDMEAEAEAVAFGVLMMFGQTELARGSARYATEWARTPERVAIAFERACHVLDALAAVALGNPDAVVKESAKAVKAATKASNKALAETLRENGIEPRGEVWRLAKVLRIESSVFCLADATDENGDPRRGYVWTTGGLNDNGTYEVDSDGYAETADEARAEIAAWVGRTARFYVLVTDHVEVESRIERRNLSREGAIVCARQFALDFAAKHGAHASQHHGGLENGIESADGDELGYVEVIRHGSTYGAAGVLA